MINVLEAIRAKFLATPALVSAWTGGYHFGLATEGTKMPYVVSNEVAAPTTMQFGGEAFSEDHIDFVFFTDRLTTMKNDIALWLKTFDDLLIVTDGKCINFTRKTNVVSLPREKDEKGNQVYKHWVEYCYAVEPK